MSNMVVMTFTAPSRPLSINESNRMHWAARTRRLKDWGVMTKIAYRHLDKGDREKLKGQKVKVYVHIPFSRKSRRDPHNYVGTNVKVIVDALIDAGMSPDDTSEYIEVAESVWLQFIVKQKTRRFPLVLSRIILISNKQVLS